MRPLPRLPTREPSVDLERIAADAHEADRYGATVGSQLRTAARTASRSFFNP